MATTERLLSSRHRAEGPGHLPSKKVFVLQHVACEKPGLIAEAVQSRSFSLLYTCTFEGQPVPRTMGEASGLVVMGGPMSVYEQARYPFSR